MRCDETLRIDPAEAERTSSSSSESASMNTISGGHRHRKTVSGLTPSRMVGLAWGQPEISNYTKEPRKTEIEYNRVFVRECVYEYNTGGGIVQ